jgi:hypothetical protein
LGNLRRARAKLQARLKENQDTARAKTEQSRRSRGVFVQEICLIVNDLELILEEFEVQDGKRDRRRGLRRMVSGDGKRDRRHLLERSVLLSVRGLKLLAQEPFIYDPDEYYDTMRARLDENEWAVREELRHDSTTLKLFLEAECRLLRDLGVSGNAVGRLRDAIEGAIQETSQDRESLEAQVRSRLQEQMGSLIQELTDELSRLYDDDRHEKLIARLAGVFEALGGALVVAGNAAVGAIGTPVTAGISLVGAAVSTAVGTEVISRGVDRARS